MEGFSFDALRSSLFRLLPILLLMSLALMLGMYLINTVLPGWNTYQTLSADVAAAEASATAQVAGLDNDTNIQLLQGQVTNTQEQLAEMAAIFMTEAQADAMLQRLYGYAEASGVQIVTLQAQQTSNNRDASDLYESRGLRLQVVGETPQLMNFVIRIQEATLPGMALDDVNISESNTMDSLVMDVTLYVSTLGDGVAYTNLPQDAIPTPMMPTFVPTPTITPTPGGEAAVPTVVVTPVPADSGAAEGVAAVSSAPSGDACPGAPESIVHVGDSVIVDFNTDGALRILRTVDGTSSDTLGQAYDNEVLVILDGPVCGSWQGQNLWYWYVDRSGQVQGWVAEASPEQRWLCPANNPECA